MNKSALAAAVAGFGMVAALPTVASAQDSGWAVQVGPTYLSPANKSDAFGSVPADAIHVDSKTLPEIDVLYSFTPNIVGEAALSYPQTTTVTLSGTNIGTFKEMPSTFLAQYHFMPGMQFDPYVGLGANLTSISSVNINEPGVGALDLSKSNWGVAGQLGAIWNIDRQWYGNADVKYAKIGADVNAGGATVSKVNVDPFLFSLSVGYRF